MKVLDLQCAQGHGFEGWFADEPAFVLQQTSGALECPLCGNAQIRKLLSAPRLNFGAKQVDVPKSAHGAATDISPAADDAGLAMARMRTWIAETENVGDSFAVQALAMHEGDVPARPIRGVATAQQAQALRAEGVDVLPLPPFLCEPQH